MPDLTAIHYHIQLAPDLERFTFDGRIEITLRTAGPVTEVRLNAADLAVWGCAVRDQKRMLPCPFRVDPEAEELRILLPQAVCGDLLLGVDFAGRINDTMAGFYRSRAVADGTPHTIAVTQFQESDARRAFPCLDHPAQKAVFDIELEVDRCLAAVSNTDIRAQEFLDNGRKRVIFEPTPKMSTYLVFFAVGPFETLQDHIDSRVRVLTLPGQQPYAGYGLEFGRKALQFSEAYYGIPYPLSKMDLIAVPDFAFGAMENWGAITFRENLLLHVPGVTSQSGEERICEVIAHEIAHQWFGNLVTPADWKYLWLNESFATYFGYGVVAHYHPEWEIWQQFSNGTTGSAMARDGLIENFPIEIPGGEHLVINTSTAPIIYNKGGSILRQIEDAIGPESFQRGLQRYLTAHAYGCAESRQLWEAFEAVSDQPVSAIMQSWIEQAGLPVITAARDGGTLVLSQKRFTYLPHESAQRWMVPLSLLVVGPGGAIRRMSILMDGAAAQVPIGTDAVAYKLNAGQSGFYRTRYADPENLKRLAAMVQTKQLSPEDRWGLQEDLFAQVMSADASLSDYLEFLAAYTDEEAYLPLSAIAAHLAHARLVATPEQGSRIAAWAQPWYTAVLERIGLDPRPGERQTTALLRDQLLFEAVQVGSHRATEFALQRFGELARGGSVHPDILKSVLQTGAWHGAGRELEWLERRFQESPSEHERLNVLTASGCFRGRAEIERALDWALKKVPPRNQYIPVVSVAANPNAAPLLWDWYRAHLTRLEQFHPMLYERVIAAIIPVVGPDRVDPVRRFFGDYLKGHEKLADAIRLSLERLEINLRMRRRNAP
jgi:tricorn protease interacting factor F2/3